MSRRRFTFWMRAADGQGLLGLVRLISTALRGQIVRASRGNDGTGHARLVPASGANCEDVGKVSQSSEACCLRDQTGLDRN